MSSTQKRAENQPQKSGLLPSKKYDPGLLHPILYIHMVFTSAIAPWDEYSTSCLSWGYNVFDMASTGSVVKKKKEKKTLFDKTESSHLWECIWWHYRHNIMCVWINCIICACCVHTAQQPISRKIYVLNQSTSWNLCSQSTWTRSVSPWI